MVEEEEVLLLWFVVVDEEDRLSWLDQAEGLDASSQDQLVLV